MHNIRIFSHDTFGSVRTLTKDEETWFVAADVCKALNHTNPTMAVKGLDDDDKMTLNFTDCDAEVTLNFTRPREEGKRGGAQFVVMVNEPGLYQLIIRSNKPEAKAFKRWITHEIIPFLRKSAGLEGFEVFRMLDKEHQKAAMDRLKNALNKPSKVDYIIANTIADKAVSTRYGYPKMIRKADMTPNMLQDRESVLDDTVQLMALNEKYHLGLSVSTAIYAGNEKAN